MTRNCRLVLLIFVCTLLAGCETEVSMPTIEQVRYTADSGPVLPELQWHEEITISATGVNLVRNGRTPDTRVNVGTWVIAIGADEISTLFRQLQVVECDRLQRVEPDDSPDGGGTVTYEIMYTDGKTCELVYDPGVTYTHGEQVSEPVRAFIQGLTIPLEASARIR